MPRSKIKLKIISVLLTVLLLAGGCAEEINTGFSAFGSTAEAGASALMKALDLSQVRKIADDLSRYEQGSRGYCISGDESGTGAAERIAALMRETGLEEVAGARFSCDSVHFRSAEMVRTGETGTQTYQLGVCLSGTVGLSASQSYEIVYLQQGTQKDYSDAELTGKIAFVLCEDRLPQTLERTVAAAGQAGAAGVLIACDCDEEAPEWEKAALYADTVAAVGYELPVLWISNRDAVELIGLWDANAGDGKDARKALMAGFSLACSVVEDQTGFNVSGIIRGADDSQAVIIGAAYDHWYHGYNDSATSVGLLLALADAIRKSGYVPQKTLIFTAYGGSVYGAAGSPYALHNGLQAQLEELTAGSGVSPVGQNGGREVQYALYLQMPSYRLGDAFRLSAGGTLTDTVTALLDGLSGEIYPAGVSVEAPASAAEAVFLYEEYGIGAVGICTVGTDAEELQNSDADVAGLCDDEALAFSAEAYCRLLTGLDTLALRPLAAAEALTEASQLLDGFGETEAAALTAEAAAEFAELEQAILTVNERYRQALAAWDTETVGKISAAAPALNDTLKGLVERILEPCTAVTIDREIRMAVELQLQTLQLLNEAVDALTRRNVRKAREALTDIGNYARCGRYDAEICAGVVQRFNQANRRTLSYLYNWVWEMPVLHPLTAELADLEGNATSEEIAALLPALEAAAESAGEQSVQTVNGWKTAIGICRTQLAGLAEQIRALGM